MIDVHAHLCYRDFDKDVDSIVERCRRELEAVVVSAARHDEGIKVMELCRRNPGFLFPTLGYHPTEGSGAREVMELIRENRDSVVAVGEVGLDYHWEKDPHKRKAQQGVFLEFIALAQELRKPLVIHSWDAEPECFRLVRESGIPCVFHCYSGSRELVEEIVQVPDFYVSISTQILFNKNLRKVAKRVPLERVLLETDAPFLSPVKGERNYPWNILLSADKLAKLLHADSSEILNSARENAERVFGIRGGKSI